MVVMPSGRETKDRVCIPQRDRVTPALILPTYGLIRNGAHRALNPARRE